LLDCPLVPEAAQLAVLGGYEGKGKLWESYGGEAGLVRGSSHSKWRPKD